ncbi:MAG TPA: Spy/CpxP family protein refolding chaperone [Flavisolibacter sp.]|nr:Spy/CpxP family protein refolding chaperone [Flavisolibacter sp.]
MKKILTTALAIVLFVGASQAQDKPRHERGGGKYATELNLTAEQKTQLQALREAQKKEMEALKQKGDVSKEQRKAIAEKYKTQYSSILTPAQKEQMAKKREEWKAKGKEGKGKSFGKRGGDRGAFGQQAAFFKKELNLSSDQETKLKGIFQEFQTKSKDLRSNNSLTQEQKRTQMQSLSKQYMDQGKAVLNAEQLQKLNSMKGKNKSKRNKSNV